ncbi:hypothetical protein Q8A64_14930 [Oxalobacteraceae bacterium R-40]|uniref:Lipoprotein n=1 Tax=Keguizhuia sedimenti TaxID=3064264 RepID=A0ABU1BTH9_9BURK|nr:hypothetical protein [Oxalobacteraceae bacterium R-40]
MQRSFQGVTTAVLVSVFLAACGGGGGGDGSTAGNDTQAGADSLATVTGGSDLPEKSSGSGDTANEPAPAPDSVRWEVRKVFTDFNPIFTHYQLGLMNSGMVFGNHVAEQTEDGNLIQNFIVGQSEVLRGTTGMFDQETMLAMNRSGQILGMGQNLLRKNGSPGPSKPKFFLYKYGEYIPVPVGSTLLNDAEHIAGTLGEPLPNRPGIFKYRAFTYIDGVRTEIPLVPGAVDNFATAMNSKGHVVGYTRNKRNPIVEANSSAFVYRNGRIIELGKLPGTESCAANDINNRGVIIGTCSGPVEDGLSGINRPFIYHNGSMTPLPGIGEVWPQDFEINNAGQIIGNKYIRNDPNDETPDRFIPFLYSGGTLLDLNELPGIAESGWLIGMALRINRSGQILALGLRNDEGGHILLTPVKTSTATAQ